MDVKVSLHFPSNVLLDPANNHPLANARSTRDRGRSYPKLISHTSAPFQHPTPRLIGFGLFVIGAIG